MSNDHKGTVDKTAIALSILIVAGYFGYTSSMLWLILPGCIGGFIVAMITIFKQQWAPYTVPIYALLEGLMLGGMYLNYMRVFKDKTGNCYMKELFYRL